MARKLRRYARLALLEELLEVEEDLRVALRSGEGGERGAGGRGHLGVALRRGEQREGVLRRGIEEEKLKVGAGGRLGLGGTLLSLNEPSALYLVLHPTHRGKERARCALGEFPPHTLIQYPPW